MAAGKDSIHKNFRMIEVTDTGGNKFNLASCYSQDSMQLEVDPSKHPAWTNELNYVDMNAGNVAKFNTRFAGLNFGSKKEGN